MDEIIRGGTDAPTAAETEAAVPTTEKTGPGTATEESYDPEDEVYRSLDWETNPPINGFYEMMMASRRNDVRNCAGWERRRWKPTPPDKRPEQRRRKEKSRCGENGGNAGYDCYGSLSGGKRI